MSLLPVEQPHFEEMQQVVERYIKNENPTKIAREMGIRRVDVLNYIEEWRASAVGNDAMAERVNELIAAMDNHYSMLIQKSYSVIEEVDAPLEDIETEEKKASKWGTMSRSQMLSQKMNAIKTIADLEAKRIDLLQKSGLLEAADVGDQLAEMEANYDRVLELLDEHLCRECKPKIMGALAKENKSVVVMSG